VEQGQAPSTKTKAKCWGGGFVTGELRKGATCGHNGEKHQKYSKTKGGEGGREGTVGKKMEIRIQKAYPKQKGKWEWERAKPS